MTSGSISHCSFASAQYGLQSLSTIAETAWDFTQFFVVAHVPVAQVYDQQVLHERGQELLRPLGINYYPPYVRPAVGVLPIRPLRFFSYWKAFWLFAAIQFGACVAILWISIRYVHVRPGDSFQHVVSHPISAQ